MLWCFGIHRYVWISLACKIQTHQYAVVTVQTQAPHSLEQDSISCANYVQPREGCYLWIPFQKVSSTVFLGLRHMKRFVLEASIVTWLQHTNKRHDCFGVPYHVRLWRMDVELPRNRKQYWQRKADEWRHGLHRQRHQFGMIRCMLYVVASKIVSLSVWICDCYVGSPTRDTD